MTASHCQNETLEKVLTRGSRARRIPSIGLGSPGLVNDMADGHGPAMVRIPGRIGFQGVLPWDVEVGDDALGASRARRQPLPISLERPSASLATSQ